MDCSVSLGLKERQRRITPHTRSNPYPTPSTCRKTTGRFVCAKRYTQAAQNQKTKNLRIARKNHTSSSHSPKALK